MNASLWAKLHGGSTHFPIALVISSLLFDLIGYALRSESRRRDLHAAGLYALLLGALASFAAVLSGLALSHGEVFGSGSLARHHGLVWPAFGLIVGLAAWRLTVRRCASRRAFGLYLGASLLASGLVGAAGYWGGELLLGG